MKIRLLLCLTALVSLLPAAEPAPSAGHVISIKGTRFLLNGEPFPLTGVSFFNAIYNPEFNRDSATRRQWLAKFQKYGVNLIRVWAQWDNRNGFVDAGPDCTLYLSDGTLRADHVATLRAIIADADALGMVVELALFANESRADDILLKADEQDRSVAALTAELKPHRNLVFQIWNEYDGRVREMLAVIKQNDPARLVTSSPGWAGHLGDVKDNAALDFLTPHTSRIVRHWQVAPDEIAYLLKRYNKPVVDDEPARNGTTKFGGPEGGATSPYDHIIQIARVWELGGYVVYHHDMFQTGYGTPAIPPSGIPDPEFSPYHHEVFKFLALRDRYLR